MNNKTERRVFNSELDSDLSYLELKDLLEKEKRHDSKNAIKEKLQNKIFAKLVFLFCIFLNILFIILAALNYMEII